ncbi:hypothetical protein ACT4S2_00885 [Kocuria turfanensis]|uniref:hypothetical protein n=1 Tax=Kocuria turfanensis TaxID=388357 RepID=UPI004035B0A0
MSTITSASGDAMVKKKQTTARDGEQPHRILDRLNAIAMRVYGPGDRLAQSQEGQHMSEAAERWYQEVQEHFYVEKDQHGNEYLYHRDDSGEGTNTGSARN